MNLDEIDELTGDQIEELFNTISNTSEVSSASQIQVPQPSAENLELLLKYFGHRSFKPLQWEIISNIVNQKRDVCAIMNTGYGKSLCYQYPSMVLGGVTLVVSPLIALMEDQVLALEVANIKACFLGTAQKRPAEVMKGILENQYTLVYLTPEFCTRDRGVALLKQMSAGLQIDLIGIDEAHCISGWGHDFRADYRKRGILRDIFPNAPIIAVTATATTRVREDIVQNLRLINPLRICSGFDRPNLFFVVGIRTGVRGHLGYEAFQDLKHLMTSPDSVTWKFDGPTIIYCISRQNTEDLAKILQSYGVNCLPYHAGLKMTVREEAHELFMRDKVDVIIATIAFRMGIVKPDIRNVIHYGCSKTIENYYQEVGRAGRDGLPGRCVTPSFECWKK